MSFSVSSQSSSGPQVERCLEELRRTGCRVTPQRRLIVEALLDTQGEHLNAQELFTHIRAQDPTVGLATVYRTMELRAELGLVHRLRQDEGFVRFGLAEERASVRFVCRCCGRTEDAPPHVLKVVEQWAQDISFSLGSQAVAFTGMCATCQTHPEEEHRALHCTHCGCGRRRRGCPRREEN